MKKKKNIKKLKILISVIVVALILELFYVLYMFLFASKDHVEFDGINSYVFNNNNYVAVGSNNNNGKHYEKAKLSVYDDKFNKTKEKLYNRGYNSTFYDVLTDEKNYVVVGSYENSKKAHRDGNRIGLIVKYDDTGKILFEDYLKDLANSSINSIKKIGNDYLVCGNSNYTTNNITNINTGGAYLIRYNKEGKVIWKRNFGDKSSAKFNDFVVIDNYIYAVGINSLNIGLIAKYDINGNFITSYDYNNIDNLGFSSITYKNDYLYVCGGKDSNNSHGLIVKFDYDLSFVSEKTYDSNNSRFNNLMFDDDHLITIGTVNEDDYDGIIGKYNEDLSEIDVVKYGDVEDDYFTDIKMIDDKYVVSGYTSYDNNVLPKFISYSDALKVLEVK